MKIRVAHLQTQGINFAVFEADARSHSNADRRELLADLTARARRVGLRVQKSALAYSQYGRTEFFGTPDLVDYLASNWLPEWTHELEV